MVKWDIYTEIITLGRGMKCEKRKLDERKGNIQMPRITNDTKAIYKYKQIEWNSLISICVLESWSWSCTQSTHTLLQSGTL